ncbi:MAG: porin family protein [Chitinophagaceae bacterium]
MKIYLIAATAAILMVSTAEKLSAQHGDTKANHVTFGVKGGLNVYNIHNDNNVKYDTKLGFHLGMLGHIHLSKQFALQPELLYSAQGAKYTIANNEYKLNLGYINVPVMLQYMFDNGFRLQAGPQIGFLTRAKSELNNTKTDVKDNFKTVDFAVGFGVGYVSPKSGLGIDARYNLGVSDINENSTVKSTNRGFQVGLFYLMKH